MDELEVKIHGLGKEDRKNTGRISELSNVRERLARTAAAKVIHSPSAFFVITICVFLLDS